MNLYIYCSIASDPPMFPQSFVTRDWFVYPAWNNMTSHTDFKNILIWLLSSETHPQ